MHKSRPGFNPANLWSTIRKVFDTETKDTEPKRSNIKTTDCLMSGCALFSQKFESLLQFEKEKSTEKTLRHNLKTLYGIQNAPCDTYMRERIDGLSIDIIRKAMKSIISILKVEKKMNDWKYVDNKLFVSVDGVQFFSSKEVHCQHCCERKYTTKKGKEYKTYHHQMSVACIINPNVRQVLPIAFEPICNEDGQVKNDCERNATNRLLENLRGDHPGLDMVIVADGLSSNAPFIKNIKNNGFNYLLIAKDSDHQHLINHFWTKEDESLIDFTVPFAQGKKEGTKQYRFMKNVPLNASNPDVLVNVIYTRETVKYTKKDGNVIEETRKWIWVTDLEITRDNIILIEKGARARWKIENETFNTLKNQGYNFEHNYGHGYKTLSNMMASMMLLVFLVDQILEAFNKEFQGCLKKCGSRTWLWEKIRSSFFWFLIGSWDDLYAGILDPPVFSFPSVSN